MWLAKLAAPLALAALAGCTQILGFGDPRLDPGGGGSSNATGPGTGGAGGVAPPPPCDPTAPVCNLVDSECLALVDNSQLSTFGFRVSQVSVAKPDAFAPPALQNSVITQAVTPNLPDCNLVGSGYLSWLLEMDITASQGRVGASKPVADPTQGYSFINEMMVSGMVSFDVHPVTVPATLEADGTVNAGTLPSVTIPIYLDAAGTTYILVPIHEVRLLNAKISADHNCIGTHNAAGLRVEDLCLPKPEEGIYSFIDGGEVDGYILLEEADDVIIEAFGIQRSLCIVLAVDSGMWGVGVNPMLCERWPNLDIKFPGDWCSTTDAPSDGTCHDAMKFSMGFAASAVAILP